MSSVFRKYLLVGVALAVFACDDSEKLKQAEVEFTASQEEVEIGGTVEFTLVVTTGSGESEELDYSGTITLQGNGIEAVGDQFEVVNDRGDLYRSFEGPTEALNFELRFNEPGFIQVVADIRSSGYQSVRTVTVLVIANPVESVSLNRTSISVGETESFQLVATVEPSDAIQEISWSSSNSQVARVTSDGLVTARAVGEATITVTSRQGGVTATCEVTVNPASPGRTLDSAISLGTLELGEHAPFEPVQIPGDTDWFFVFTVNDGDHLALSMNPTSGLENGDVKGRLYDGTQEVVSQEFDIPVFNLIIRVTPLGEFDGKYYLRLRIDGDRDTLYSLELRVWPDYH